MFFMEKLSNISITKYANIISYIILVIISSIYILRTNDVIQFEGGDNAYYLFLGKAIADGIGYRDTFSPDSPPNVHFPPLFPLLIAAEIKLFGLNIYIIKLMLSVFAVLSLLVSPVLFARYDFKAPLLPAILFAGSYIYFYHSDQFLTEPIFIACMLLSLFFFEKYLTKGAKINLLLSVLFSWACILTRTAGVAIAVALPLAYLVAKEKKLRNFLIVVSFFVILILPFFVWSLRNRLVAGETSSYLNQFMLIDPYNPMIGKVTPYYLAMRIVGAVRFYFTDTTETIVTSLYYSSRLLSFSIAGLLWGLFIVGFVKKSISKITAVELLTLVFLFITLSWPFRGYRFLMPLYLFIFGYTIYGALFIVSSIKKQKILSNVVLSLFILLSLAIFIINLHDLYDYYIDAKKGQAFKVHVGTGVYVLPRPQYPELGRMLEAALWLKNNTPNDGITLSRKPSLVALAGVKKVIGPEPNIPMDPAGWLYKNQVKYILVDEVIPDIINFMRVLTKGQSTIPGIKVIYKNENTYVIETNLATLIQKK